MLLTKVAILKWNNKNRKYYESLGYKLTKSGDSFKVPVEQLTPSSKAEVEVLCDFCKEVVVKKKYQVYIKQHHAKYGDCCAKCQPIKNKLCCLDKYGVDVLADDRAVAMFEQVHIAESTLGSLATAAHIVFRGYTLEIDVPAVKLALSDDEMWSNCRLWDNYVLDLLSSLFGFL